MKIENNSVVAIHYTLKNNEGEVIDSSEGKEPLRYLAGTGNIIPGLDDALLGLSAGDTKTVVVQPENGYGETDESLVQTLPREVFSGIDEIQPGMEFQAQGPNGEEQYVVVKAVAENEITIDGNHVLAGVVLNFDVSVAEVREATEEEIAHGHVH